jgi:hypothetical protein
MIATPVLVIKREFQPAPSATQVRSFFLRDLTWIRKSLHFTPIHPTATSRSLTASYKPAIHNDEFIIIFRWSID